MKLLPRSSCLWRPSWVMAEQHRGKWHHIYDLVRRLSPVRQHCRMLRDGGVTGSERGSLCRGPEVMLVTMDSHRMTRFCGTHAQRCLALVSAGGTHRRSLLWLLQRPRGPSSATFLTIRCQRYEATELRSVTQGEMAAIVKKMVDWGDRVA